MTLNFDFFQIKKWKFELVIVIIRYIVYLDSCVNHKLNKLKI